MLRHRAVLHREGSIDINDDDDGADDGDGDDDDSSVSSGDK